MVEYMERVECRWNKTTYTPTKRDASEWQRWESMRLLSIIICETGMDGMFRHPLGELEVPVRSSLSNTLSQGILFFSRISSHLLSNGLPVFLNCPFLFFLATVVDF